MPRSPVSPGGRQRLPSAASDEKRERILQAAELLFDKQGYAKTTMEQIVQALGVTKPFVYYYFRNKQEIYETLCWKPSVACFTVLDSLEDDPRPAHEKVLQGIEDLIRATITHYPSAFFYYREPQVFRAQYDTAFRQLANGFYDKLCLLLEEGREDGKFEFNDTRITAQAACSLPGFLYNWYSPTGRLSAEDVVQELSMLAYRVLGLRTRRKTGRSLA